jgi:hypothetical protein
VKMILKMKNRAYIARVGILLIAIALIVGTLSCGGGVEYSLTMAVSPVGSGTTTPTGTNSYAENTSVNIKATALDSYTFVQWTSSDEGTFGNTTAATTTFTMPAQNVTVTANFVGPLDHFKVYNVNGETPVGKNVTLEDEFGAINVMVGAPALFANPTEKVRTQGTTNISNPDHHLTFYWIGYPEEEIRTYYVEVHNQFGTQNLTVWGPLLLAVPTQKEGHAAPLSLDHFLVYMVQNGPSVDVAVGLNDEFGNDEKVMVEDAFMFANPVQKTVGTTVTPIEHPAEHLVFYEISGAKQHSPSEVVILNQFNLETLTLGDLAGALGVPSQKITFEEQVDHFTCYPVPSAPPANKVVELKDQFVDISSATVMQPMAFCNPAQKEDMWPTPISHPDYHLTLYLINYPEFPAGAWNVTVTNQFGTSQNLTVWGPIGLAVPTWKTYPGEHQEPVGLDHYLLYEVVASPPALQIPVGLTDEFGGPEAVTVGQAVYFANPVEKTVDGDVTPIENPMNHLVFYDISDATVWYSWVGIYNQFQGLALDLGDPAGGLAVPSLKLSAVPKLSP